MRWVITRNPETSLKSRMVVLGFTDSWKRNPLHHRHCHDVVDSPSSIVAGSQCSKPMQRTAVLQGSVEDQELHGELVAELSQAWGLKTPPVCTSTKKRCVGKNRERHDKSRMENPDNRAVFGLKLRLKDGPQSGRCVEREGSTNGNHGYTARPHSVVLKSCRAVIKVVGRFHTVVRKVLVLLELPSARRKQRDESMTTGELSALRGLLGTVDAAYISGDSSVASTLLVASGLCWSYHSFPQCFRPTNLLAVRWVGLRHRCELVSATVFVLLAGLMQVGWVAVKGHHKVGISLELQTHHSWSKRNAKLVNVS